MSRGEGDGVGSRDGGGGVCAGYLRIFCVGRTIKMWLVDLLDDEILCRGTSFVVSQQLS